MQNQDIYPLLLSSENAAGKGQKDYTNQEEGDGILGLTQPLQSLTHSNCAYLHWAYTRLALSAISYQ